MGKKRTMAVIPARANSKGIPNKNLRMVGGYPLIYYSIKNALESEWVDKVVVSTDSDDIKVYAGQLGAHVVDRDANLCGDDVTLDDVVADAVADISAWDYVVTLQPTSPTLKAQTLDRAIKYAVEKESDTVLAVINRPHLAWVEKEGRHVPAYTERANRQFLPPYYMETGAFVISRASLLNEGMRIGGKIDVFEVSEDEAVDVDSFQDLIAVTEILCRKKVAIYVNGNNKRGIGHIYRALEIADEFFSKPDIFFDSNQTERSVFGNTMHHVIPVNGILELFEICGREQYSIFINDILSTSIDYMIGLRSVLPDAKIVNIEDSGEGAVKADAVINALFDQGEVAKAYCGEKYFIPRKLFLYYKPIEIREKAETMFVCFGGSDPRNYTDRILKMVTRDKYSQYHFIVAIGRAKENVEELMEYNSFDNIEVYFDVSNMPGLMSRCDFAVASRGRTCYELAMLGIPTISISENAREQTHNFISAENGFSAIGVGPDDETVEEHIRMYFSLSKTARQHYQNMLLSHDLRNGRENFRMILNSL